MQTTMQIVQKQIDFYGKALSKTFGPTLFDDMDVCYDVALECLRIETERMINGIKHCSVVYAPLTAELSLKNVCRKRLEILENWKYIEAEIQQRNIYAN